MQRIEFNTGREYTKEGQRITAEIIDTKTCSIFEDETTHLVRMIDHSRGLDYLYEMSELTEHNVMRAYDGGSCLSYSRSADGSYERLRDFWKRGYKGTKLDTYTS